MIPIQGKPLKESILYRPIILLAKSSKKTMLERLLPILEENRILQNHQFRSETQDSTMQQYAELQR
jgi:hypothetical protein